MIRLSFLLTALSLLSLTSCTTTSEVSLDYVPNPGHVQPGAAEFSTQPFVDRRDMGAMELGMVRTQIGTPIEKVLTKVPIASVVSNALPTDSKAAGCSQHAPLRASSSQVRC